MILAGFEQEFVYTGVEYRAGRDLRARRAPPPGPVRRSLHGRAARRRARRRTASCRNTAPRQYEVTIHPTSGVRAADEAVIQREMARAVAHRLGHRAIFSPILDPDGVGNGTHIHFSLRDARRPAGGV